MALYSARRDEMVEAVQATLFYMNPDAPIPVHSPFSALPYEVRNCSNLIMSSYLKFKRMKPLCNEHELLRLHLMISLFKHEIVDAEVCN